MTKDGRWRSGSIGWCPKAGECKNWKNDICGKCFKEDLFEPKEDSKNDGTDD